MNPGEFSRLNRDRGIGFVACGEIGDSVFLAVMERQYILKQERNTGNTLQSRISPLCLIENWVVSSESVVYVDTELYKDPRWKTVRKLDSRTHSRPSSLGVPRSPLSSHPKWVHDWWPLGEIRRFARRSTQHKEFVKTRDWFIERLERYNNDETDINKCKKLEFTKRPGVNFGKMKSKGEKRGVCWSIILFCHVQMYKE